MIWHKLIKRVDAPGVIPAPILILLSVVLIAVIAWQEEILATQEHAPQNVIIELEPDAVAELEDTREIPEMVQQAVATFMAEVEDKKIDAKSIRASDLYKSLEQDNQIDFISFAGRELTLAKRYDEALDVLGLISLEQMLIHGSSFSYASSLSKEGRDEEALTVYAAHHKAHPEHQAGAFNYGLMLAHFNQHEEANYILAYAASISSGSFRGKALSAQADELLALGRVEETIEVLKKSIEYRPDSSIAWYKLANVYQLSPKISQQDVVETYAKASALASSKYRPIYNWANYLFSVGRFREAISLYVRSHYLAKDRFDIMFNRALNLHISGRPSSALRILKSLERQGISRSQKGLTTLLRAIIDNNKKDIQSEANQLEKSSKIDTDLYKYLLFLASLELNQPDKSVELLQGSLDNLLYRLPMQYSYARSLYEKEKYEESAVLLKALTIESPASSQFRYDYARALRKVGNQEEALKEFAAAYSLEPHSKRISLEYSDLLLELKQYDMAVKTLENLLVLDPGYNRAMLQLAQIHTIMGDDASAVDYLKQALEQDVTDTEISLKLIQAQISLGQFKEALAASDEILTIDSGLIEARMFRATLLSNLGNIQECYIEIDRILALDSNYEPALRLKESLAAETGKPLNNESLLNNN